MTNYKEVNNRVCTTEPHGYGKITGNNNKKK